MELTEHPAARAFPRMEGEQWQAFLKDVRENGVREPIVVLDGQIVDGIHRKKAADECGIKCPTRPYDGDPDLDAVVKYVISANLSRRHLTDGQRVAAAENLISAYAGDAKRRQEEAGERGRKARYNKDILAVGQMAQTHKPIRRARQDAAAAMGVSDRQVERMTYVRKHAPELVAKIESGEMKVTTAEKLAKQARDRKQGYTAGVAVRKANRKGMPKGQKYTPQDIPGIPDEMKEPMRGLMHALDIITRLSHTAETLAQQEWPSNWRANLSSKYTPAVKYLDDFKQHYEGEL